MIGYAILGVLLTLPLVLGLVWRVSASHLFFSVMAGELLARYFGENAEIIIKAVTGSDYIAHYGEVMVQVLPVVATAYFLRNSISKSKAMLHSLPLLITGMVFTAFTLPMLPESVIAFVQDNELGDYMLHVNNLIIGVVIFLQLLALWFLNRSDESRFKR